MMCMYIHKWVKWVCVHMCEGVVPLEGKMGVCAHVLSLWSHLPYFPPYFFKMGPLTVPGTY